jgi:hypothetical protein
MWSYLITQKSVQDLKNTSFQWPAVLFLLFIVPNQTDYIIKKYPIERMGTPLNSAANFSRRCFLSSVYGKSNDKGGYSCYPSWH